MANISLGSTFTNGDKIESKKDTLDRAAQMMSMAKTYADSLIAGSGAIEFGTNVNGGWMRLENGVQICWHSKTQGALVINTAWGDFYRETVVGSDIGNFPKDFSNVPLVLKTLYDSVGNTLVQGVVRAPTRTHPGDFEVGRPTTVTTGPVVTNYIAIGEWD